MSRPGPTSIERIVLLGFMGSGKSTVAVSLARRLEWDYLDFDSEIEEREGHPVPALVASEGEEYLRELEAALTAEVSHDRSVVLAPGGGWITRPELLRSMPRGTLSVWLSVSPEETVSRMMRDERDRPLKGHADPLGAATEMLREREPLYRLADLRVPGDGRTVEDVAFEIEVLARLRGI